MALLGYPADPQITVEQVRVEPTRIAISESITFTFEIRSYGGSKQNLMIDYLVCHMRANGQQTAKVFKLAKVTLQAGQIINIKKKHSFRRSPLANFTRAPMASSPRSTAGCLNVSTSS